MFYIFEFKNILFVTNLLHFVFVSTLSDIRFFMALAHILWSILSLVQVLFLFFEIFSNRFIKL